MVALRKLDDDRDLLLLADSCRPAPRLNRTLNDRNVAET
jgi:hypothetical protein